MRLTNVTEYELVCEFRLIDYAKETLIDPKLANVSVLFLMPDHIKQGSTDAFSPL